jgi:putative DNA methylase
MPRDGATVSAKDKLAQDIAKAVGAGRPMAVETVDFSDPNRPKTCIEVDFPILAINQVAQIEGNAGKPIYQMSKWWARRRSSVFRAMLLASAMKAPDDPAQAAKAVWEAYYANHQKKGALKQLKVADIFMGGGTTLVEGSRLGMQMTGVDLNPVAWFVVKQEFAKPNLDAVKRLLADVEAEVKPQIMPFYACEGPGGEKGVWTRLADGKQMGEDFDALALTPEERKGYAYSGPEAIYTFWAKHGPCQVTGCGHRTPIMSSNIMAVKTLTVKRWPHVCSACGKGFDIEDEAARMAPDAPLVLSPGHVAFSVPDKAGRVTCPHCRFAEQVRLSGKGERKKVDLALVVDPDWVAGTTREDASGAPYGGAPQDYVASTVAWNSVRAAKAGLIEIRGMVTEERREKSGATKTVTDWPEQIAHPLTGAELRIGEKGGTVPKRSTFECTACGRAQDVMQATRASGKGGQAAGYAIQGYAPRLAKTASAYGGRFFAPFTAEHARRYSAACGEWEARKSTDLAPWWPRSGVPDGFMTVVANSDIRANYGFTNWHTMFNSRQLLAHALLLKTIMTTGDYEHDVREFVLGAYQQYLRNQNMFCIWNVQADKLEPHFSNNNYHPKATPVENCVFGPLGRGNWFSCVEGVVEGAEWAADPWEAVATDGLRRTHPTLAAAVKGKSEKVFPDDPVRDATLIAGSATDLADTASETIDLVITDPPFGGLLHYSELADFFHVWLRLGLKARYQQEFGPEHTPKTLEAVANRARQPEEGEADAFYQRLLTQAWREAHRVLKPGGMMAFTFHHSEDEPWVAVLEALFDAGFYLEATYPIRSDETKGEGEFGSKTIEYDIIHVCRKRMEDPKPVSWARMRREVLEDVKQLQGVLEAHAKEGLPAADLAVIKRGKALEYFSRHYGQVFKAEGEAISVKEAIIGINQILDEGSTATEIPPVDAEPYTRQFLRIFADGAEQKRDQMQKFLRGTGSSPDEFEERGWCSEKAKVYHLTPPLEIAQSWHKRQKRKLDSDYDQAMVLIGACHPGSGLDANDTLRNPNFKPHPALRSLLEWFERRGHAQATRDAAKVAKMRFDAWQKAQPAKPTSAQMSLFGGS